MFVLVVGGGKVGAHLAEMLRDAKHEVAVVEQSADRMSCLREELAGVELIEGDGCEPTVLEHAGIRKADTVVAVTGDDEDNLVVCLLAKTEYGVDLTIGRINNPRNDWLFDDNFGVDVSTSHTHIIAKVLLEEVAIGDLVTVMQLVREDVALVEITLPEGASAIGRPLADLGLPPGSILVAIIRGRRLMVPGGDTSLELGDEILAVTHLEQEASLRAALVGRV